MFGLIIVTRHFASPPFPILPPPSHNFLKESYERESNPGPGDLAEYILPVDQPVQISFINMIIYI